MNNKLSTEREPIFESSMLEAVFRQAVIEDFEEEIAGLLAANLPPVVVSERHKLRMKALFTRRRRRSVKRTLIFALRWAAVAVIALVLAGCAALAVPAIRRVIIERFIQFYENSMVFHGGKSLQTMLYWEPYYIPDGFSDTFRKPPLGTDRNAIAHVPAENGAVKIVYTREHVDGGPTETIVFSYAPCDNPTEGEVTYRTNENSVMWDAEGLSFSVTAGTSVLPPDLLIEELLKIAHSTEKREIFIQPPLAFWQPMFIPRGYTETRRDEAGEYKMTIVEYTGVNGDNIKINVLPADDTISASFKNSDYYAFESGGIIYHSIVDDNLAKPQNSLLWELKGYYFVINSELPNDEMIKIAQSMRQYEPKNHFPYAPEDLPNGFVELHRNAKTFPDGSERSYVFTTYGDDIGNSLSLRVYPIGESKIPPVDENTTYNLVMDGVTAYHTYTKKRKYQPDIYEVVWKFDGLRFEMMSRDITTDELLEIAKSVKKFP